MYQVERMEREVESWLYGTQKGERGRECFVRCFFYGPTGHQLDTLNTEQKATSVFMLEMRCEESASPGTSSSDMQKAREAE